MIACPSWCSWHVVSDDGSNHFGADQLVHVEVDGGPAGALDLYVASEVSVYPGQPIDGAVRLQADVDCLMTAEQALSLAAALQLAAFRSAEPVPVGDDGGYAESFAAGWELAEAHLAEGVCR